MPCFDGGPSEEQREDERRIPAMLCALASVLEREAYLGPILDRIDWNESGLTREWFARWWKQHKVDDAVRRREEREARERRAVRAAALAKLTPEERAALGG